MAANFSELEHRFVIALEDRLYAEREFSDVDVKDMANDLDISIDLAKEALGSLCKKEVVFTYAGEGSVIDGEILDVIEFTEQGCRFHKRWAEELGIEYVDPATELQ